MSATVEIRPVTDPQGRPAVLLQLEHGWVTLLPADARDVAARLTNASLEIDDA